MRRFALACLLSFAALSSTALAAPPRPDSAAPPGAAADWLPSEEWVMEQYNPFDASRLYKALRMPRAKVYWYLKTSNHNLADLARRRGLEPSRLARRLLAPRAGSVSSEKWVVLQQRTARMFDQRHLAEHVLGHPFHHWSVFRRSDRIWGPSYTPPEVTRLVQSGVSLPEISRRSGVPPRVLRRRILGALDRSRRHGVLAHEFTAAEARAMRREQRARIGELVPLPGAGASSQTSARPVGRPMLCHITG